MANTNNKQIKNGNGTNGKLPKKGFQFKFQIKLQNILLFVLALLFIGPFLLSLGVRPGQESVPVSQVLNDIKENKVENVKVSSEKLALPSFLKTPISSHQQFSIQLRTECYHAQ